MIRFSLILIHVNKLYQQIIYKLCKGITQQTPMLYIIM